MIESVLTRGVSVELSTSVLDLDFKLSSRSVSGALEVQVLKEMSST